MTDINKEVMPGIFIDPQVVETSLGPVEVDVSGPEDGPCVLSVHGGLGGVDQARVMVRWLEGNGYRLICPSRPGYLNTPLENGRTVEEQADLLAALLDALEVDRSAVISASAGGPPAYMMAVRHPGRVSALIAVDSVSGYYDMPETAGPVAQAIFTSQLGQKLLKMIGEKNPRMFLEQIFQAESYFTKEQREKHIGYVLEHPEALEFMRGFMNTMNPYAPRKAGTDNDMVQYRGLTHLPVDKIKSPALIIHGTHDADVKFYDGVYAYENIPGARRYWMEEASHLGFWFSPHAPEAQEIVREFIAQHADR